MIFVGAERFDIFFCLVDIDQCQAMLTAVLRASEVSMTLLSQGYLGEEGTIII